MFSPHNSNNNIITTPAKIDRGKKVNSVKFDAAPVYLLQSHAALYLLYMAAYRTRPHFEFHYVIFGKLASQKAEDIKEEERNKERKSMITMVSTCHLNQYFFNFDLNSFYLIFLWNIKILSFI